MSNLLYCDRRLLVLFVTFVLVTGISSYRSLPRMEDPLITPRVALVSTLYPGASATRVEALVTDCIEDELGGIDEIKELRSVSRTGVSIITIRLREDVYEVDDVWSRVRDRLDDAALQLPSNVEKPVFDDLESCAYAMIVALTWEREDQANYAILGRLAEQLQDKLRGVPGTEKVDTYGAPREEIVVTVRPEDLIARSITAGDVAQQLAASDAKVAAGHFRGAPGDLPLEVDTDLNSLVRVGETPIQYTADGSVVRLADVASIQKGIADPAASLSLVSGKNAVTLGVLMRPDFRIDRWHKVAALALEEFVGQLPRGVGLTRVFSQHRYVEDRLASLQVNLLIGGLAVVGVSFFLLGWRNALVVGCALPLASLMVLTGLKVLRVPIHQMSVSGLIIALGLLIDNAVVMVDDVSERMQAGSDPGDAVRLSVRHLVVPLLGSTLTTGLAFAPMALMEGATGEFVGAVAISVILAISSSFVLAMTVIPAVAAILRSSKKDGSKAGWWQHGYSCQRLTDGYRKSLDYLFQRPVFGVALGAAFAVVGFALAGNLTEQFFPPADRDQFHIELELPAYASLRDTLTVASQVRETARQRREVEDVHWFLGESAPMFYYNLIPRRKNASCYAQGIVSLRSSQPAQRVIRELQCELDRRYPAARLLVRQLEQGPAYIAPVEVRLFGPDVHQLRNLGEQARLVLATTPDVIHTRTELAETLPKLSLSVDEEQARLAGLSHAMIANQLDAILEGAVGGSVLESTEELPVRVRLPDDQRASLAGIESLDLLPAAAADTSGVPLSALASISLVPELAAIPRFNGRRMNELQAYLPAGVLPAEVLTQFLARLDASGFELPEGYSIELGGETAKRSEAVSSLMEHIGVLLILMVTVLVLSFRSFRVACLIGVVAVLSAGFGMGTLWLFGYPFGFMAIVGTMGLVGIAINDAIVVIAALREDARARVGDPAATREVVVRATRHVVVTSLTTMAGFAPLVLAGGGFWPPLAMAIAGGVLGATALALYFVPAAYLTIFCRRASVDQSDGLECPAAESGTSGLQSMPSGSVALA